MDSTKKKGDNLHWYYKYLPYFILERKLTKEDPDDSTCVEISKDKIINFNLIEVEKGVWIGRNERDALKSLKNQLEKKVKYWTKELEDTNARIQELS